MAGPRELSCQTTNPPSSQPASALTWQPHRQLANPPTYKPNKTSNHKCTNSQTHTPITPATCKPVKSPPCQPSNPPTSQPAGQLTYKTTNSPTVVRHARVLQWPHTVSECAVPPAGGPMCGTALRWPNEVPGEPRVGSAWPPIGSTVCFIVFALFGPCLFTPLLQAGWLIACLVLLVACSLAWQESVPVGHSSATLCCTLTRYPTRHPIQSPNQHPPNCDPMLTCLLYTRALPFPLLPLFASSSPYVSVVSGHVVFRWHGAHLHPPLCSQLALCTTSPCCCLCYSYGHCPRLLLTHPASRPNQQPS